jgi:hypothetical protein
MLDVVHLRRLGVAFTKDLHSPVKVHAVIVHDHAGDAGLANGVFQTHGDSVPGRTPHRLQGNQFHVLVAQSPTHGQIAQADAEDDQTLGLADLDRVVDHPDPINGDRFDAQ